MKKKSEYVLGRHTDTLLHAAFPLIILKLLVFIALVLPLEGGELIRQEALLLALSDAIGRGIAFLTIGVIVLCYLEKKEYNRIDS